MDGMVSRVIPIRFDGLDATNASIDMHQFGTSITGISRILKSSSHFAIRHEYAKRIDRPYVRILARPPKDGSLILEAIAIAQTQLPLLQPLIEDVTWELVTTVVGATLLSRSGRRKDMDWLMDTIDKQLEQQNITNESARKDLVGIVHRLIDANQAAVKLAVRPIGHSAGSLQIGTTEDGAPIVDLPTVDGIRAGGIDVGEQQSYRGTLDGLTLQAKSCRIALEGHEGKYTTGKITDPEIMKSENLYTRAFHEGATIEVQAKAVNAKDGSVETLYISDARIVSASGEADVEG